MIDIHSHILPGVDDGASDWEETLELCKAAYRCGITHIVATPHFIPGVYTRGMKWGNELLEELKELLAKEEIDLEVFLTFEIEPFPEIVEWITANKIPLYPSKKHILIEAPFHTYPSWLNDLLRDIKLTGITPILAHPERCLSLSVKELEIAILSGVEVQIDASSILGLWGDEISKKAYNFLRRDMVHYIASDAHKPYKRDPCLLKKAKEKLKNFLEDEKIEFLTEINPKKVITP